MRVPEPYPDEFAFFEAAAADELVYRAYRLWVEQAAGEEVDKVIVSHGADPSVRFALLAAAMGTFERAFALYARRERTSGAGYPFSEYFRWWARQGAALRAHQRDSI